MVQEQGLPGGGGISRFLTSEGGTTLISPVEKILLPLPISLPPKKKNEEMKNLKALIWLTHHRGR